MEETKECVKCGNTKPTSEFGNDASPKRKDGKYPYCRSCVSRMRKTPMEQERAKNYTKLRRDTIPGEKEKHISQERARRYRRLYDISVEDYDKMLAFQDGVCAICGRPPKTLRLSVDHDHKTGEVRGLLCYTCNATLHDRVDMEWLFNAHAYLDVPPVHEALGRTPIGQKGRVTKRRRRKKTQ